VALRILVALIFIISLCPLSSATIINIPADWPTIQQGIDASVNGDTVLVQPGTYVENINFNGHNIVLGSLFLTTGDTSYIDQTVIDGDSAGSVVTFDSGEDATTIISGLTIFNGFYYTGGGIHCGEYASPLISNNNIIENNSGGDFINGNGGGIFCHSFSNPIITNNLIYRNSVNGSDFVPYNSGGGIYCAAYSNPIIAFNSIINNLAFNAGGGIYCYNNSNAIIVNNLIKINNVARYRGGGIACDTSDPVITNNLILFNEDGGIYLRASNPLLKNSIIWGNISWQIFGSPNVRFCNVQGGWPGEGNIDVDPIFRNSNPYFGDFHLMSIACGDSVDSPCIDAGDPDILDSLLDCSWGLGGTRSDMGAYGGGDSVAVGILDDIPPLPDQIILLQNYPNPFNARTSIRFVLPESQDVQLTIYDLLGRQVETLFDDYMPAGAHAVTFDASRLSSGIYFARLESGESSKSIKMVLLK